MQVKIFDINKIEKKSDIIEERINSFLSKKTFKFATQSEQTISSRLYISVFFENGESKTKAKVFKSCDVHTLEKEISKFLLSKNRTMKWATQTSSKSNVFCVIFYEELGKVDDKEEENKNEGQTTSDKQE